MGNGTTPFAGPAWTERLPLHWELLAEGETWRSFAAHNAEVIRNCLTLGEPRGEAHDDDPQREDIARIENKLNALFDMVGMLLAQSIAVPEPVECVVQSEGLQWRSDGSPPQADQLLRLSLYLNRRYPRPLELCARVEHVTDERPARVTARFVGADDGVSDGLARIIFREHRREVASSRRAAGGA
jgi:hypothetical protein